MLRVEHKEINKVKEVAERWDKVNPDYHVQLVCKWDFRRPAFESIHKWMWIEWTQWNSVTWAVNVQWHRTSIPKIPSTLWHAKQICVITANCSKSAWTLICSQGPELRHRSKANGCLLVVSGRLNVDRESLLPNQPNLNFSENQQWDLFFSDSWQHSIGQRPQYKQSGLGKHPSSTFEYGTPRLKLTSVDTITQHSTTQWHHENFENGQTMNTCSSFPKITQACRSEEERLRQASVNRIWQTMALLRPVCFPYGSVDLIVYWTFATRLHCRQALELQPK
jgi:hypothetical protein